MNEFSLKDGNNCPEMWPGGSWQQWPLQPSMFQNIPHEEIDWAALAQQWIQMRETMGGSSNDQPHTQHPPHPSPAPLMSANIHAPPRPVDTNKPMKLEADTLDESSNSQDTFRQGEWNYWNSSNWNNAPPPAWNAATTTYHTNEAKESLPPYEYGQAHGNQGFAAQSYDYNHGSDQYSYSQTYVEQNQFNQFWPAGQSGTVFPRKEHRLPIPERDGVPSVREEDEMTAMPSSLDAAKRKQLPAWIREGLEKMEREKQKRLEKERLMKEREEQIRSMKEAEERAMKEFMEQGNESLIPRKSKFDSDSEDEEETNKINASPMAPRYSSAEEEEDEGKSDEEKLADLMMRVRQMLTEILLEVTNEEVNHVAKEVFQRAKAKAPAMQLASSSALASITLGLGLGDYGSDDSEESGGEEDNADDSDDDLRASITLRKKEFSEKEREIVAKFKTDEAVADIQLTADNKQNICDFIHPSPEREKYHFEKKYNEIPGLDVAPIIEETNQHQNQETKQTEDVSIKVEKDSTPKETTDKDATNRKDTTSQTSTDSDSDSRTSSSGSRNKDTSRRSTHSDKTQKRTRSRSRDRRDEPRRRSRSRDRRQSRSSSRGRRSSRNYKRDRSSSRDRRQRRPSYGNRSSRDSRKDRNRRSSRSRSQSPSRRRRGRRSSRSYSRSRSRSPRKQRRGRENSRRESRSPSGEGSGKKSSRKQTT